MLLAMLVQVTLGLFATDIDGLESGPLSHLVSFDAGRVLAEAHELSFNVLIALAAVHVGAILFYLLYDRNDLTSPMLSGRKRVDSRNAASSGGGSGRARPSPRSSCGGLSEVKARLPGNEHQPRHRPAMLSLIAMEAVFRAVRELADALCQLRSMLRVGRDARAHDGRRQIPESEQHVGFLP